MSTPKLILIVDDEEINCELLASFLETFGHESEIVNRGADALARLTCLEKRPPDLVLMDVMMPEMNGYDATRLIRSDPIHNDIPVVMVTALTSKEDRLLAVEAGANDFISKPIDKTELRVRVASLLKMKEAQDCIKRHSAILEETVQHRTAALQKALQEVTTAQEETHEAHLDTIYRLAVASEHKDRATALHVKRVSMYCELLAQHMGLSEDEKRMVAVASPMHDVGKLGIPDAVLLKPGKLNDEEWQIMKKHTTIGQRILSGSNSDLLQAGELIAISHHEKWDGTGYPNCLAGEDIHLWGRICAIADVYDALTQQRPYKAAIDTDESLRIMREDRGKHFDPDLLDLFMDIQHEVLHVQNIYSVTASLTAEMVSPALNGNRPGIATKVG